MPAGQYVRFKGPLAERMEFRSRRAPNGCLEWQGTINDAGYGLIRIHGQYWRAHRVAFHLSQGPIPDHLHVCHSCDNPRCIEPSHLWLGTNADNTADMDAKGRRRPSHGEQHFSAKVTEVQVRAIRADPASYREIGKRYGISHKAVSRIKCLRVWRHVPIDGAIVRRNKHGISSTQLPEADRLAAAIAEHREVA